jgi:hypothetical protein
MEEKLVEEWSISLCRSGKFPAVEIQYPYEWGEIATHL